MSYVIELPGPIEDRIEREAKQAGISPSELVANVVRKSFGATIDPEEQKRLNAPSIALLQTWLAEAEKPRTDQQDAEAEEDMADLMRSLNAPRRESGERLHFPGIADKP